MWETEVTREAKTCKHCDGHLSVVAVRSNGRTTVYHFCKRCDGIGVVGYLPINIPEGSCGVYLYTLHWKGVHKPGHEPRYSTV